MTLLIAGFAGLAALVSLADVTWRHVGAGMAGNSYWLTVDPNDDETLFYAPAAARTSGMTARRKCEGPCLRCRNLI